MVATVELSPESAVRQLFGGKLDDERAPATVTGRDANVAALCAGESAGNGEPEPGAANVGRRSGGAVKRLEDPLAVRRWNSAATIRHLDL